MYFLFSGEGSTDMGTGKHNNRICEGDDYEPGPMALLIEQLVTAKKRSSSVLQGQCGFLPKTALVKRAKPNRPGKKNFMLPGAKTKKDTRYFYSTAYSFGITAIEKSQTRGEQVVAVLFRDSDDRKSSGRKEWSDKWDSMIRGFAAAKFDAGVPMLPKPISEAWLLCALKEKGPYDNCAALERRSPSPKAKRPLKQELNDVCGGNSSRSNLCALVEQKRVSADNIDMPSFNAFRERLLEVI